jgi:hypothetical protein
LAGWVTIFANGLSLPFTERRSLSSQNEHENVMALAIRFLNVIVSG